jgi:hypothetical protein
MRESAALQIINPFYSDTCFESIHLVAAFTGIQSRTNVRLEPGI